MPPSSTPVRERLTGRLLEKFLAEGAVRVPAVIPRQNVEAMAERLWAAMARDHGAGRHRPESWPSGGVFHFRDLVRSGAFADMLGPPLSGLVDEVLGARAWARSAPPQPLVTFPAAPGPWRAPKAGWHLDLPAGRMPAAHPDPLRLFTFLEPVARGAGGTAYVAGSHRLAIALARELPDPAQVRSKLLLEAMMRESPWMAALRADGPGRDAHLGHGTTARDVDLRLGEFTGDPGDVILMHPALVHTAAANRGNAPRLMLTLWVEARAAENTR